MPAFTKTDFRALDAAVAEQVMGWRWMGRSGAKFFAAPERLGQKDAFAGAIREAWDTDEAEEAWWLRDLADEPWAVPHYSTDIAAAMDVLCKARGLGTTVAPRDFFIGTGNFGEYSCGIEVVRGTYEEAVSETISEAICRAAIQLAARLASLPQ